MTCDDININITSITAYFLNPSNFDYLLPAF